jgi:membrane-associated phospholipid phosphatase
MHSRARTILDLFLFCLVALPASAMTQQPTPQFDWAQPAPTRPATRIFPAATLAENAFPKSVEVGQNLGQFPPALPDTPPTLGQFPNLSVDCPNARVPAFGSALQSAICTTASFQPPRSQAASAPPHPAEPLPTPKAMARNIFHDQISTWKFPLDAARGRHWKPALAFIVATGGLVALDPHDTPYFRRTQSFSGFNRAFSSQSTGLAEAIFPGAFFLAGRLHHDAYAQQTALLSGRALVDALVISNVMKVADRRLRPRDVPPGGDFGDTWFKAGGGVFSNRGGFPSGHTIGAFAMATVIAERYHQHRWVPWVAYGLAGVVGFSRVSLQAHFPSDVFAGAVLGYALSHYVVLRRL